MRKIKFYFLTGIALAAAAAISARAQTVATIPEGMMTFTLAHGTTTYLSLPLTSNSTYTSVVAAVTTNSITVDDTPAPFTTDLATAAAPYFIKFLSGNEAGRVMLITSNTTSTLTLDTTDNTTGSAVALTTTGFSVQAGDTFEVFPGDTLASIFGANTTQNPLVLTGAVFSGSADTVGIYNNSFGVFQGYYFNTTAGYWELIGSTANANNTIIYPYSAFTVSRRASHPDMTLVVSGRVTQVAVLTKVVGSGSVYASTHYATDVTLSQLQFGSNWTTGTSSLTADTLGVWDAALGCFDSYYQLPDSTWRKTGNATTDQSSFAIAAGTVTTITKREAVSSTSSFLQSGLPYSLD